ncbi:MAG: DUF86 domain-containing protein [Flavobacteriales bacterium]|nr:DUF86 domain-containing protein [Flavobacteriales bacterium]
MRRSRNQRFDFFLLEMLAAAKRILNYTEGMSYETFVGNGIVRDAVIRNFEILGEGVKHIPFSIQKQHKRIPWTHMLMLRNFIVHEFFDIDDEILWEVIIHDLSKNVEELEDMINQHQIRSDNRLS